SSRSGDSIRISLEIWGQHTDLPGTSGNRRKWAVSSAWRASRDPYAVPRICLFGHPWFTRLNHRDALFEKSPANLGTAYGSPWKPPAPGENRPCIQVGRKLGDPYAVPRSPPQAVR